MFGFILNRFWRVQQSCDLTSPQIGYTVRLTDRGIDALSHGGHMRLSVPNIPPSILAKSALCNVPSVLPAEAVQRIASFLSSGKAAILTGAGVSVDSGVKAYRGKDGRYMNPDYKYASLRLSSNCEI